MNIFFSYVNSNMYGNHCPNSAPISDMSSYTAPVSTVSRVPSLTPLKELKENTFSLPLLSAPPPSPVSSLETYQASKPWTTPSKISRAVKTLQKPKESELIRKAMSSPITSPIRPSLK